MAPRFINVLDMYSGDRFTAAPDFATLKAGGVLGVIHRASAGLSYVDPVYGARRAGAEAAGLLWGAYHSLDAGNEIAQAAHFLEASKFSAGDPILLAVEFLRGSPVALHQLVSFMAKIDTNPRMSIVLNADDGIRELLKDGESVGYQHAQMIGVQRFLYRHRLWLLEDQSDKIPFPWNEKDRDGKAPGVFMWRIFVNARQNALANGTGNFFDGAPEDLAARWVSG